MKNGVKAAVLLTVMIVILGPQNAAGLESEVKLGITTLPNSTYDGIIDVVYGIGLNTDSDYRHTIKIYGFIGADTNSNTMSCSSLQYNVRLPAMGIVYPSFDVGLGASVFSNDTTRLVIAPVLQGGVVIKPGLFEWLEVDIGFRYWDNADEQVNASGLYFRVGGLWKITVTFEDDEE